MGIFIKRPLCLFCFCFMAISLAVCLVDGVWRAVISLVFFLMAFSLFRLARCIAKRRIGLLTAGIALMFCAVAALESFLALALPTKQAEVLCSDSDEVVLLILDEEYSSRYSSKYKARLEYANGDECSVNAYLFCEYEAEYLPGDMICFVGEISMTEYEGEYLRLPPDRPVTVCSPDENFVVSRRLDGFDFDVMCAEIRMFVSDVLSERLDFDTAAFSVGLLTGDTEKMNTETVRDFRRSGLSHILAVSGLHLVVLIGGIEFLLKMLGVRKSVRCVLFSCLSFLLMILSGFSGSACRSVIMLICTYLLYILSREPDALTSLGVSGFVIFLTFPSSVGDIGFWLSFLATLGLVSWLDVASRYISVKQRKGRLAKPLSTFLGKFVASALVTFAANIFVCIVSWLVFGEMSVVSLIANLIVTPISDVYLFFIPIVMLFGGIPFLNTVLSAIASGFVGAMESLVAFFSGLEFAVVSLRYPFASVIILSYSLILLIMLIIKLKRKYLILFPPALAIVAFSICFAIYGAVSPPVVSLVSVYGSDALVVSDDSSSILIDVGDGRYSSFLAASDEAGENCATEFEAVVLTHYHERYASTLDRFFRSEIVRSLYLPMPEDEQEVSIAKDISDVADMCGVELYFYERESSVNIEGVTFAVSRVGEYHEFSSDAISIFLECGGHALTYTDGAWRSSDIAHQTEVMMKHSEAIVFGSQGPSARGEQCLSDVPSKIAFVNSEMLEILSGMYDKTELIFPEFDSDARICRITLE